MFDNLFKFIFPKSSAAKSNTPTFDPGNQTGVLTTPSYLDHLTDFPSSRLTTDANTLLLDLIKHDPDVSAALNAALTLANTDPVIVVRSADGSVDREATKGVYQLVQILTSRIDYSLKFQWKPGFRSICETMRTMLLLRGAIACEVVTDKAALPQELRIVDPITIEWMEKKPGVYKPMQRVPGENQPRSLDIPNFFITFFRRDPTSMYPYSSYVSAINTIAARQQLIADLYRIMQVTGYPRLDVKVLEEVVVKNAPANIRNNPKELKAYLDARLTELTNKFNSIRPDQAFIHYDSTETKILNEKSPGMALDISAIIETLNAQNQAGLKTMSTVIGRGNSGTNTASVEARIAAMMADEINFPLGELLSAALSYLLHLQNIPGIVEVRFRYAEMRPDLELEPQRTMKAARLKEDLSLGIIDDDTYHLEMYGRIRPDSAPVLSGTGFMSQSKINVDEKDVTPNSDPLGRSLTSENSKSAKSKTVKKVKSGS